MPKTPSLAALKREVDGYSERYALTSQKRDYLNSFHRIENPLKVDTEFLVGVKGMTSEDVNRCVLSYLRRIRNYRFECRREQTLRFIKVMQYEIRRDMTAFHRKNASDILKNRLADDIEKVGQHERAAKEELTLIDAIIANEGINNFVAEPEQPIERTNDDDTEEVEND